MGIIGAQSVSKTLAYAGNAGQITIIVGMARQTHLGCVLMNSQQLADDAAYSGHPRVSKRFPRFLDEHQRKGR